MEDATWLDDADINRQFPDFCLQHKADFQDDGNVTYEQLKGRAKGVWIVYSRRSKKRPENQEGQS